MLEYSSNNIGSFSLKNLHHTSFIDEKQWKNKKYKVIHFGL